jgi:hypothetical protein
MQNKAALIGGIIGGIVLLGGGFWFISSDGYMGSTNGQENMSISGKSSLTSLMARGGNYMCMVTMDGDTAGAKGEVYIAGQNVKATFSLTVQNQQMVSYMIQKDGYVYSWTNAYAQGVKTQVKPVQEVPDTPGAMSAVGSTVSYDCKPWKADQSIFVVPTNITFTEVK